MSTFSAPLNDEIVLRTTDTPRLDLLKLLAIDPVECAGRSIRLVRVYSGGNASLFIKVNGEIAQSIGAIVDRNPKDSRADWLYMRDSRLEITPDLKSLELEAVPTDDSKPELRVYGVEVLENQ